MLGVRSKVRSWLGRAFARPADLVFKRRRLEQSLAQFVELEARLRESEARYRTLVEQLPLVTYIDHLDETSSSIYASPQIEQILGYSPEEWLADPELFPKLLHPEDRERVLAEHARAYAGGESFSTEYRLLARDGRVVWFHDEVTVVHDDDGQPLHAQGFQVDITQRKRAEEALQQKTALLELLQDVAVTANESSTIEEALQVCLDRVCAHTGWPVGHVYVAAEDSDDMLPTTIWHLEDKGAFEEFRQVSEAIRFAPGVGLPGRALASARPLWVTDVTKDRNFPRALWAEQAGITAGFAFPVLAGTEVVAVLEFFSPDAIEPDDVLLEVVGHIGTQLGRVVERARAEAALRESEAHYRSIVETANDAFIAIKGTGEITDWNREAERTFGWTHDEAIGRLLTDTIIPPEYRQAHQRGLERFLATGEGRVLFAPMELTALHRDGREFPVELRIWPVEVGRSYRFNAFVRDITERRSLEEQLRHSQKMEAVGRLAGGVAHDFNNLLTAITGYSDFITSRTTKGDPVQKDAEEIRKAADKAATLTRQLLAFSRKQVLQPTVLDLNSVMADLETMLRRLIGEHIQLVTSPSEGFARVKADRGQLEQMLVNLAVNARDAMPEGGTLAISTVQVALDQETAKRYGLRPGPHVMLVVGDTGCGMDEETRAQAFEPFFTTKEQGKGTGLGLATVYGIVEQSGGHIQVESSPGRGASFTIHLPAAKPERGKEPRAVANGSPEGTETVLLVEDEDVVRAVVREILENHGYTVLTASGGEEALSISARHRGPIEVLLTDVVMADMNGRLLADRVSSLRPETKVIYMSGYTDDAMVHDGARDAEVAFLQKPFTSDELARKLREVLGGGVVVAAAPSQRTPA